MKPRMNSLVKLTNHIIDNPKLNNKLIKHLGEDAYIYLGEMTLHLGHCILVHEKTGMAFIGYHTSNFRELIEDEL